MPRDRWSPFYGAAAALLYTLLAALYLRPVWRVFADHIAPDPWDPVLNLYILKWGERQIGLGLPGFWDANFFFPLRGALTLSDHLFGPALQLFALRRLGLVPGAVAGYNLLFFTSFVLSGWTTAWVLRRAGCSRPAAFLAGCLWAFAPLRWHQLNHLQVLLMQWIPPTLWTFDRLLAERTGRRAAAFLAFYLLHLAGGCYLAYMIHLPMAAILLSRGAAAGRGLISRRSLRVLVPVGLVALVAVGLLFAPYASSARRQGLGRQPREAASSGAALASYLSPSPQNLYFGPEVRWRLKAAAPGVERVLTRAENALFPGFVATAAGLWGLALFLRRHRAAPAHPLGPGRRAALAGLWGLALLAYALGDLRTLRLAPGFPRASPADAGGWGGAALLLAVALALALGLRRRWGGNWPWRFSAMDPWQRGLALGGALSFLLSHPIAYLPLMRVVPGLAGMRVPARFAVFATFALVAFAALGLDDLAGRTSRRKMRILFWAAVAAFAVVELAPRPLRWVRVLEEPEFPAVYRWLARAEGVGAVLEVPFAPSPRETTYMYYSTAHWKPIANGYSGYQPPVYRDLARRIPFLPGPAEIDLLRRLGVTHLVVHGGQRRIRQRWEEAAIDGWERRLAGDRLRPVHRSGRDRVYRLAAPAWSTPNRAGW